ncbi:MAG: TonB-dependent receptor [Pseudomonadota bacterium]
MLNKPEWWLPLALIAGLAQPAWSQGDPAAAASPAGEPAPLDTIPVAALPEAQAAPTVEKVDLQEVQVSATRRKKSINKTAIAVTEISGVALTSGVIRDTQSTALVVPSLVVTVSGNEAAGGVIRIRGVGTPGTNAGLEGSVGVFVDGVYLPRSGLAFSDLLDIERIEVLRGPQGTLFGKNTSAGAINILTKKPSFNPEAIVTLTGGDYNSRIAQAIVSGPVFGDKLALRLAGQYNKRDGFIQNVDDGEDYNNRNRYSLRGQALWQPNDEVSLRLIAGLYKRDELCCIAPFTLLGPTAAQVERQGGTVIRPPTADTVAFDGVKTSKAMEKNASVQLEWKLGDVVAKGLISHQLADNSDPGEADFTNLDLVNFPFNDAKIKTSTAEFGLSGKAGWLDWVGGAFLSREKLRVSNSILLGDDAGEFICSNIANAPPASPAPGVALPGSPAPPSTVPACTVSGPQAFPPDSGQTQNLSYQTGKSASLFTHNVINFPLDIDLTVGLRYLVEAKDGGGFSESNSPSCNVPLGTPGVPAGLRVLCGAPLYQARFDDKRITGTGGLSKTFFDRMFLYTSFSSGFKSGGINLNPSSTNGGTLTFQPEKVKAYELGLKVPFFGKKLTTRTAYFYQDFTDYQLNFFDGTAFVISNAGQVISRGVEFESTLNPFKPLKINAGVTYADAFFGKRTVDANLRDKQFTSAPKWTGTFSVDYRQPLPFWGMSFNSNVAARYQSKVNTSASLLPQAAQPGYTLINGRLGLGFKGDLDISAVVTNLTDEVYYPVIFASVVQAGSFNGYPGPPRTIGLELRKRF